ncbi:MAG TPA: LssY C-terminal domain-containing protein [Candidatus Saccharimonadales bacterium]|nr:LssY C-terminal domain-containing protein [Candidatus Saccharimonadales bacterium]
MLQYFLRPAKRFAVLVPGVIIAYFSVRNIFPYFENRLPAAVAIFITYVVGAYVLVPAMIRLLRVLWPPKHLPLYCVTPDGFASDPLNIGIIATRDELVKVMEQTGWYVADRHTARNVARVIFSIATHQTYRRAPVSSLYLFGRKQDIAFEIPTGSLGGRHHVRFWATSYRGGGRLTIQGIHWHHRRQHLQRDNLLWVGAASLDKGLNVIRHNLQLTHMIDADTDQERELIVRRLRRQGRVESTEKVRLDNPYRLINRTWRGALHTDGTMTVVKLKK